MQQSYRLSVENSRTAAIDGETRRDIFGVVKNALGYSHMTSMPSNGVVFFEGSRALSREQLTNLVKVFPFIEARYTVFHDDNTATTETYVGDDFNELIAPYVYSCN